MRGPVKPMLVSIVILAVLAGILVYKPAGSVPTELLLYCAAGMKQPVAAIARAYEKEYGVTVAIQYGGSGTLLSNLRITKMGDLYLAADASYIERARKENALDEAVPLARIHPVLAVKRGNPRRIFGVKDLLRPDVKTALGNPDAASIGEQTELLLKRSGLWQDVQAAVRDRGVFKPTVNDVANDVKLGTVDAGIVWDATANQYPELEAVAIQGSDDFEETITVGVLKSSSRPTAALRFMRYLGARDKGLRVFAQMGFPPVQGDVWAETPEITYFSGAVNRLGIQETLSQFERREGVRILTVYNGCGILLGQIKLGEKPDVYHTCDVSFMRGVEDGFLPPVSVTETDIVILVGKGNPRGIKDLQDLARPGLKLGMANEQQSTLGALTVRLLNEKGLYESVVRNVVSQTPTADLLVNQIRTESLDAVIVYRANTALVAAKLDIVPIADPAAKAVQSFAIGKNSEHKYLVRRLFEAICSAESKARFSQGGFRWVEKGGEK